MFKLQSYDKERIIDEDLFFAQMPLDVAKA